MKSRPRWSVIVCVAVDHPVAHVQVIQTRSPSAAAALAILGEEEFAKADLSTIAAAVQVPPGHSSMVGLLKLCSAPRALVRR